MNRKAKLAVMGAIAGAIALTDNRIKNKIENGSINNGVIDKRGLVEISKHHNKGLPLNKLDKHTQKITVASTAALFMHAINTGHQALNNDDVMTDFANTLILSGALSNIYDRVTKGYVVDYLMIGRKKAIYNISDFCIIGGVILSVLQGFKRLSE